MRLLGTQSWVILPASKQAAQLCQTLLQHQHQLLSRQGLLLVTSWWGPACQGTDPACSHSLRLCSCDSACQPACTWFWGAGSTHCCCSRSWCCFGCQQKRWPLANDFGHDVACAAVGLVPQESSTTEDDQVSSVFSCLLSPLAGWQF